MPMAVGFPAALKRADKILRAITDELMSKQKAINADPSVRSVTVIVKLKQGTDEPRAVLMTVETERSLD